VLAAAHRSQAARNALRSAYELVMARAEKISDPALRGFFLQQVKFNQDILREYEAGAA
jgi:hypothetical protein